MSEAASEHLWNLVETGKCSDCSIFVYDGENLPREFKVHKLIIENSSQILKYMLERNLLEGNPGLIIIEDISYEVLKRTLRNIYCCSLDDDLELTDLLDLLKIANKYQIKSLIEDCTEYVSHKFVDDENCAIILTNIQLFSTQFDLKDLCLKILKDSTKELFNNEILLNISEDILLEIVNLDEFNLDNELDLIEFVARWTLDKIEKNNNEDTSIRKYLEDKIIPKLRFLTVKKEEIMKHLGIHVLLTTKERKIIENTIISGKIHNKFPVHVSMSTMKRYFNRNKPTDDTFFTLDEEINLHNVNLSNSIWLKKNIIKKSEFSFRINDSGYELLGIQMFPPVKNIDVEVTLTIFNETHPLKYDRGNRLEVKIPIINRNETNTFYFNQPFIISNDCYYKIVLIIDNKNFYCYTNQENELSFNDSEITLDGDIGPIRSLIFLQ